MTIREMIRRAIEGGDARAAGAVANHLRARGFAYGDVLALARRHHPGLEAATWDGLLAESEERELEGLEAALRAPRGGGDAE